jgi:hypothetical protein
VVADPNRPESIKISMVITRHSLPEVSKFLELFSVRGLKAFQFNALLPITTADWGFGHTDQYLDLWCGHLPNAAELVEQAKEAIEIRRKQGISITATPEQWLLPVDQRQSSLVQLSVPPKDLLGSINSIGGEPHPRESSKAQRDATSALDDRMSIQATGSEGQSLPKSGRIYCPMVYNTLSVFHHSLDVSTCCYMETAPGYNHPNLRELPLATAYNDPGLRFVRRSLHTRDRISVCESCSYDHVRRTPVP